MCLNPNRPACIQITINRRFVLLTMTLRLIPELRRAVGQRIQEPQCTAHRHLCMGLRLLVRGRQCMVPRLPRTMVSS